MMKYANILRKLFLLPLLHFLPLFESSGARSLQGEAATENVIHIVDNHEGIGVNGLANGANLRQLGQLGHHKEHLPLLVGEGALAVEIGHATAHHLDDFLGDFVMLVADNDDILLIIKANGKSVAGFGHHKEGEQGVQHRLDAKEKDADKEQAKIKNKSRGANTNRIMLLDDGADDIRATAGAAHPIHAGRTNAIQHTARNASQQLIMDHLIIGQKVKGIQRNREGHNAVESTDGILPVHIFVSQKEQGHVTNQACGTHGQAADIISQHGHATDAAAEHFVGHIKHIQGHAHDDAGQCNHKILIESLFPIDTHKITPFRLSFIV